MGIRENLDISLACVQGPLPPSRKVGPTLPELWLGTRPFLNLRLLLGIEGDAFPRATEGPWEPYSLSPLQLSLVLKACLHRCPAKDSGPPTSTDHPCDT